MDRSPQAALSEVKRHGVNFKLHPAAKRRVRYRLEHRFCFIILHKSPHSVTFQAVSSVSFITFNLSPFSSTREHSMWPY